MNICGAKYGKRPWPDSTCYLWPGHDGDHEAEAWDLGGTIRWSNNALAALSSPASEEGTDG